MKAGLTGAALDWAVSVCEHNAGWEPEGEDRDYYSTNWAQGGPIIEREELTLSHSPYDHVFYGRTRPWCAEKKGRIKKIKVYNNYITDDNSDIEWEFVEYGPTPLIAAMRCYVASKLGDDVEIPKELIAA